MALRVAWHSHGWPRSVRLELRESASRWCGPLHYSKNSRSADLSGLVHMHEKKERRQAEAHDLQLQIGRETAENSSAAAAAASESVCCGKHEPKQSQANGRRLRWSLPLSGGRRLEPAHVCALGARFGLIRCWSRAVPEVATSSRSKKHWMKSLIHSDQISFGGRIVC
jgi:hypothetical protein